MRPAHRALLFLGSAGSALLLTFADAAWLDNQQRVSRQENAALVASLGLTDLALFSEARYTRHPSQADLHSAFQDHPLALEHFPSGSLIAPRIP